MVTWRNTWKEIEDSGVTTAVVTVGSTEQHGTHLPLDTDTLIAERFAQMVAEELNAYLTPSIPVGQSDDWLEFPGSLSFSADTLRAIITDIVASLVKTGFTTIVFVSIHGANEVVYRGFPEQLEQQHPGVRIFTAGYPFWVRESWARIWTEAETECGIAKVHHADEGETSLILSLFPELVGDSPTDCPLPEDYWPEGSKRKAYPYGSMGFPSKATKEKGDRMWQALLRRALNNLKSQMGTAESAPLWRQPL